jgi:hypothetical protein
MKSAMNLVELGGFVVVPVKGTNGEMATLDGIR